jgi:hypothetical protein
LASGRGSKATSGWTPTPGLTTVSVSPGCMFVLT